jgi:pimeloyl-ACP methyl ester carboxylesterase
MVNTSRMLFVPLMFALAWPAALVCGSEGAFAANNTSIGQTMPLRDEGMFFVNGQLVLSNFPSAVGNPPTPATFDVNQMFVHYRLSASNKHKVPIIMVHGAGLTGMSWETTPDGREGWGTYFTRQGFDTYVVDFPGRGRAGFNVTPLNQAKNQNNVSLQPSLNRTGIEGAWTTFRFGPAYLTAFPGVQAPEVNLDGSVNQAAVEQFSAQGVPNAEATLTPASGTTVPTAIVELLKKTGPAILMVHSQAGQFADTAVGLRPDLIKMMIHVESNCRNGTPFTQAQIDGYKQVPSVLYVHGDNVVGNPVSTGQPRLTFCTADMNAINAAGGHAALVQLPSVGIKGNDHMLMQDRNNLQVADWLIGEITKRGL